MLIQFSGHCLYFGADDQDVRKENGGPVCKGSLFLSDTDDQDVGDGGGSVSQAGHCLAGVDSSIRFGRTACL